MKFSSGVEKTFFQALLNTSIKVYGSSGLELNDQQGNSDNQTSKR